MKGGWAGIFLVGALVVLIGGAMTVRFLRKGESIRPDRTVAPSGIDPVSPTSLDRENLPPGLPEWKGDPERASASSLATRITLLIIEKDARKEVHRVAGTKPTEEDLRDAAFLDGEALKLGAFLAERLDADPSAWKGVLELLGSFDQLKTPQRVLSMVGPSLGDSGEALCIERLRPTAPLNARRIAVAALSHRESSASLTALVTAAEKDPHAFVRHDAVWALWKRRNRGEAEGENLLIDQVLRARAKEDPDAAIRRLSYRFTPEGRPTPPPVRGDRKSWSRRRSRPAGAP